MVTLPEIRSQYPQYSDMSDEQLALALHKKHYSDIPFGTFAEKIGLKPEAEDPGAFQAGLIGAGRVTDQAIKGVQQMYHAATGNQSELDRMKKEETENTRIYEGLQEKRPIATAVGEAAPLIAGTPVAGTIRGAALAGALPGAISYGTPEERALRAMAGGAGGGAGAAVGVGLGRTLQPFRAPTSATQAEARAAADRLGVQLRPDEVNQSRSLAWLTSSLKDLPFASGIAQRAETARREAINAAGARSIGQHAPELTEGVLAQARTDIGQTFERLLPATKKIELDRTFRSDMLGVVDSKVMRELRDDSVQALIAPFQNLPAGRVRVSGEWFQQNKTALDAAIRGAYTAGQNGKAIALEKFEDALMDAAKRSMTATEKATWDAAKRQWSNLRLLETGKVVEGGNLIPNRLDTALTNRYKATYKEGGLAGELPDIGKLAQAYKPLPQSGTAPRYIYSGIASGAALANPGGALAMLATPALLQRYMQSNLGRRHLTTGLLGEITPERQRRLARAGFVGLEEPISQLFSTN